MYIPLVGSSVADLMGDLITNFQCESSFEEADSWKSSTPQQLIYINRYLEFFDLSLLDVVDNSQPLIPSNLLSTYV